MNTSLLNSFQFPQWAPRNTHAPDGGCSSRSLTRMCSKMTCKRIPSLACVVAEMTLKRFFPCVQFNVAEEVTFLSKRCPALITLEWAFTFKNDKKEISDHRRVAKPMTTQMPLAKAHLRWLCSYWDGLGAVLQGKHRTSSGKLPSRRERTLPYHLPRLF